jgi:streptogrisin D
VRIHRSIPRRVRLIVIAALVGGTVLAAPTAHAATPTAATAATIAATSQLATTLADQLGSNTAGSYLDSATGKLVVTVTTETAAQQVRATGASARIVTRSGATLQAATDQLRRSASIAGTSWAVDPVTDQVVVTADSTVTGAKLNKLKATVATLGSAARLESTPGALRPLIAGGDAIYTSGARCSLGFNVASANGTPYVLTAGHCTNIGATWTGPNNQSLGNRVGTSFPGNDYGLIQYVDGWDRPGGVDMYNGTVQDITGAADPVVGQAVERSGSTSGRHGGTVTAVNATVNYAQGAVTGMIRTNVCAEPGDSGGALFAGNTALGLTSGGSGNCSSGGETFFQPAVEAMFNYGVWIY